MVSNRCKCKYSELLGCNYFMPFLPLFCTRCSLHLHLHLFDTCYTLVLRQFYLLHQEYTQSTLTLTLEQDQHACLVPKYFVDIIYDGPLDKIVSFSFSLDQTTLPPSKSTRLPFNCMSTTNLPLSLRNLCPGKSFSPYFKQSCHFGYLSLALACGKNPNMKNVAMRSFFILIKNLNYRQSPFKYVLWVLDTTYVLY